MSAILSTPQCAKPLKPKHGLPYDNPWKQQTYWHLEWISGLKLWATMYITFSIHHWNWVTHTCVSKLSIIMAWCRPGDKPLSEPMLEYCQFVPNKLQWNIKRNPHIFIQENTFENVVCEMAAFFLGLSVLKGRPGDRHIWRYYPVLWIKILCFD